MNPSTCVPQIINIDASHQHSKGFSQQLIWLYLIILLAICLSCINISYTVQFYPEGNGDGKVFLEIIAPQAINSKTTASSNNINSSLAEQGWINIKTESIDNDRIKVTAEYPFGPGNDDPHLSDVLKDVHYKVETSENEYLYYTLTAEADATQLDQFWKKLQDAAQGGTEVDMGELFGKRVVLTEQDARDLISNYGEPSYKFKVCLPGNTPVDISSGWANGEDYRSGKDPCAEYRWKPGERTKVSLEVQRRLEPESETDPGEAQNNMQALFDRYQQEIPIGKGSPISFLGIQILPAGTVNNHLIAFFNGGNFTCSDYQDRVMRWLDRIRTSPDPDVRALLNGLDYGPVQTAHGGHRSVVIYRSGGDWRTSGYVLDPWPNQRPEIFPIKDWWATVPLYGAYGVLPEPDMESGNLYPHLNGKPTSYPASTEVQGDLSYGLARPTRILLVRSPVSVMINFGNNRRAGVLPDGTQVNDLPGKVQFYGAPKSGAPDEVEWLFFLPEESFTVEMTGTTQGDFHLLIATPNGFSGYGAQPISTGQQIQASVSQDGNLSSYVPPDGGSPIEPFSITAENMSTAMGLPEGTAMDDESVDNYQSLDSGDIETGDPFSTLLCCGCPVCLGFGGVLAAMIVILSRRKKSSVIVVPEKEITP